MFCAQCGTFNEEGASFCKQCGNPMRLPEPVQVMDTAADATEELAAAVDQEVQK